MPLREGSEQRTRERVVALLAAGWDGLWSDFWIRHVSSSRKSVTVASNPDRSFLGLPQDQQLTWHRSIWAPNFWMHQTPWTSTIVEALLALKIQNQSCFGSFLTAHHLAW